MNQSQKNVLKLRSFEWGGVCVEIKPIKHVIYQKFKLIFSVFLLHTNREISPLLSLNYLSNIYSTMKYNMQCSITLPARITFAFLEQ